MKWLWFVLLLSTPVLAQASPQETRTPAPSPPHVCAMYYPPTAVRLHLEGVTTLGFNVTTAGAVTNVSVKKSSGHTVLDDASVKCVQQWQYTPTSNNSSADETRQANIVWRLDDGASSRLFLVEGAALDCIRRAHLGDDALARAARDTVVQIQFSKKRYSFPFSGGGTFVELVSSSGNGDLDNLVIGCLKHLPPNVLVDTSATWIFSIPFSWKTNVQPKTASAPVPAPR